ncbi:MAG: GNAT family N-acetyltransferase [bacterium]
MSEKVQLIELTSDNVLEYGVCGYKNIKRPGYPEKIRWLNDRFQEGLKIKVIHSEKDGTQGMIEYIPGEYAWRPVEAAGYMFIHCIFVGFKSAYKGKGHASRLLNACEEDAKNESMHGVAVVTRQGAFMVGKPIFLKRGYEVAAKAPPDFELLVKRFHKAAPLPKFKHALENRATLLNKGLIIIRADQCPYTVKNVNEISETAEKNYGLTPNIVNLKNHLEAQNSPCAFGTFCITYNGKIIAHHPISNTRFCNIMTKTLGAV